MSAAKDLLLGIDIGTSACKAALFGRDGTVEAQTSEPYPVYYPCEGWAEQDACEWWAGVCRALHTLLDGSGYAARIACVGIDGQSWATVPVSGGEAIARTPIWMDQRTDALCRETEERFGRERLFSVCGNPLQPGYCTPKILWMQRNCPAILGRADRILSSNAYIAYKMTGEVSLDLSQGYGWSFFDMRRGVYNEDLAREMGIDTRLLPPLAAPHAIIGSVTGEAARQTGLFAGTPVTAGGLDAACATLGAGVIHEGETQEQGGQAGGMSICIGEYAADPRLILGCHVVPGKWLLQGGTVGGGVMRWMRSALGCTDFAAMDAEAATAAPGCGGVTLLPYFAGERSPIWDSSAKAVYYGMRYDTTRAQLLRAGLEGTAYTLRHNLEVARDAGADARELLATGGAAQSLLWTQIKSDVAGKRILVPDAANATVLGAAMLAGVGCGLYTDFEDAVRSTKKILREHTPDGSTAQAYDATYARFRDLYDSLSAMMRRH